METSIFNPNRIDPIVHRKKMSQVIMLATATPIPNLVQILSWGAWNITDFLYIPCFWELTYRSDRSTDFHTWWPKRHWLAQDFAFLGFVDITSHLGGQITPETSIVRAWIGFFKTNSQIFKLSYYRNYYIDHKQILHIDKRPPSTFLGWSK